MGDEGLKSEAYSTQGSYFRQIILTTDEEGYYTSLFLYTYISERDDLTYNIWYS